jgi:hypothetical protein
MILFLTIGASTLYTALRLYRLACQIADRSHVLSKLEVMCVVAGAVVTCSALGAVIANKHLAVLSNEVTWTVCLSILGVSILLYFTLIHRYHAAGTNERSLIDSVLSQISGIRENTIGIATALPLATAASLLETFRSYPTQEMTFLAVCACLSLLFALEITSRIHLAGVPGT